MSLEDRLTPWELLGRIVFWGTKALVVYLIIWIALKPTVTGGEVFSCIWGWWFLTSVHYHVKKWS